MDDSDLKHNVTYSHFTQTGSDEYGQPQRSSVTLNEKCFFDLPKTQKIIRVERSEIQIEATLYMSKDAEIEIDDAITLVTDANGVVISGVGLRVARVTRASEFDTVHHLEVDLKKA